MKVLLTTCTFFLAIIFCGHGYAQTIKGRVLTEAGFSARNVTVQFMDRSNSVLTNKDGGFTIVAKKLPDTLVFSSPGFEPYKVVVTEKTLKDPNFEIVMLNSRTKLSEAAMTALAAPKEDGFSDMGDRRVATSYSTIASGPYLDGKKLFMVDSMPARNDSIVYKSGLLTAGEINDFNKWKMWEDFQENQFKTWSDHWGIYTKDRYCVQLQNKDHQPVIGQQIFLLNKRTLDTVWSAVTDNTGKAELWANLNGRDEQGEYMIVSQNAQTVTAPVVFANGINRMEIKRPCNLSNTVDIAFVVDATGSMSDEIDFLKIELEDVIKNIFAQHSDLDLHVGSVFYRDNGDEYLTRHIQFQTDLLKLLNFIKLQRAAGGGDTPESVNTALSVALDSLQWSSTARTKMLFLILDAPPHDDAKEEMFTLIKKAASKGIRIVPVVCSGAEKTTEFLMRSIALATNGSYVFLTDNSGIGGQHIKPTTDVFKVEFLNGLLQRVISQMVLASDCDHRVNTDSLLTRIDHTVKMKIYPNPTRGTITIETSEHLKEIYIADFTGKILMRIETNEKQNKYNVNLGAYPNAMYLVRYITADNVWGAEKIDLIH
jgi:hypothetical protein